MCVCTSDAINNTGVIIPNAALHTGPVVRRSMLTNLSRATWEEIDRAGGVCTRSGSSTSLLKH